MESLFPYLLWGGLFFLMMRFGCGSHMFGHRHGDRGDAKPGGHGTGHGHGCCGPVADLAGAPARSRVPPIQRRPRADHGDGRSIVQ